MDKIFEMKNVTAYRGRTRVFHGLSLEAAKGESLAIVGPNGAGKSTLLKLLTREIYPVLREGSYVRVMGEELWNVWDLRSHLGIVSQDLQQQYLGGAKGINVLLSGLYSSIDIWSHQAFTARERSRAEELLEILGISHCREKRYSEMSTGEQRRFLLGRALIHRPDVLVLDEPTSGLDVGACFQYLEIIAALMKEGTTIVLVTHHVHEIPPEVERVVLLKAGRVLSDGVKPKMLTGDSLSRLFDIPVEVVHINGFYQTMPANRRGSA